MSLKVLLVRMVHTCVCVFPCGIVIIVIEDLLTGEFLSCVEDSSQS